MNQDFHYYGTYMAALTAGYSNDDSKIIAYAAQYVDDMDISILRDVRIANKTATVQTEAQILKSSHAEKQNIWPIFHFLPGNVSDITNQKMLDNSQTARKTFLSKQRNFTKMICLPNSELVFEMINSTKKSFDETNQIKNSIERATSKIQNLVLVGLRLHILADTWAHSYFAGIAHSEVNDAGNDVYMIDNYEIKRRMRWGLGGEVSTPAAPSMHAFNYLGHGRMGHLPDYPWIKYEYFPQWAKEPIVKDNPSDFLKAFNQMVDVLVFMRSQETEFRNFNSTPTVAKDKNIRLECENIAKFIIKTSKPKDVSAKKITEAWRCATLNIGKKVGSNGIDSDSDIATFDKTTWKNEYMNLNDIDKPKSKFYYFVNAAVSQKSLVTKYLIKNGLFLNNKELRRE